MPDPAGGSAAAQEPKKTWWQEINLTPRRKIFVYDLCWIALLFVLGAFMLDAHSCVVGKPDTNACWLVQFFGSHCTLWLKYKIFFNCMWMGALGGVTISLKGVYDHGAAASPWKNDFNLWHVGRPISGAIAGLIAALLFILLVPNDKFSFTVLYGIAFIFGMQDRAFFDFLSTFAGRFLPKSEQTATPLQVSGVHPAEGKAGADVRIAGQAVDKAAIVRIGGVRLNAPVIAPDGTSVTGTVPKLTLAKDSTTDVEVINPGGRSIVLLEGFKYLGE